MLASVVFLFLQLAVFSKAVELTQFYHTTEFLANATTGGRYAHNIDWNALTNYNSSCKPGKVFLDVESSTFKSRLQWMIGNAVTRELKKMREVSSSLTFMFDFEDSNFDGLLGWSVCEGIYPNKSLVKEPSRNESVVEKAVQGMIMVQTEFRAGLQAALLKDEAQLVRMDGIVASANSAIVTSYQLSFFNPIYATQVFSGQLKLSHLSESTRNSAVFAKTILHKGSYDLNLPECYPRTSKFQGWLWSDVVTYGTAKFVHDYAYMCASSIKAAYPDDTVPMYPIIKSSYEISPAAEDHTAPCTWPFMTMAEWRAQICGIRLAGVLHVYSWNNYGCATCSGTFIGRAAAGLLTGNETIGVQRIDLLNGTHITKEDAHNPEVLVQLLEQRATDELRVIKEVLSDQDNCPTLGFGPVGLAISKQYPA